LLAGLTAVAVIAQEAPEPEGMARHWRQAEGGMEEVPLERLLRDPAAAEQLNLATNQVEALKKIHFDTRKQMIALNAEMELAAVKQAELMTAGTPDEAAILKAVEDTGAIRTKIAKMRVQQVLAAKRILTPEQQTKLKELVRERVRERRNDTNERGPRGPMGGPAATRGQPGQPSPRPPAPAPND
jgi:Spy/CpxP family protein refolding chaperone